MLGGAGLEKAHSFSFPVNRWGALPSSALFDQDGAAL